MGKRFFAVGFLLIFMPDGQIVGIEILNASEKMEQDNGILYEVA